MYIHTFPYRAANKVYNRVISERLLEHSRETERVEQIGRRKCAHRLSCKYLPLCSRKSGMVIREKKRWGDTGSRAFLIYPKRRHRFSFSSGGSGFAGWLQARPRVRAISISEQCIYIYAVCASVWNMTREKEQCVSVCLCDRKQIRVDKKG